MKVEHKIVSAFLIAFGVIFLVGLLAYSDARSLLSRNRWVVHTYEVLQKIDQATQNLQDMELVERGFLLTGDAADLPPFQANADALGKNVDALRQLTIDNPAQQRAIAEFRALLNQIVPAMQASIAERRSSGAAILPTPADRQEKANLDQIRKITRRMVDEENHLLERRISASQHSARLTLGTFGTLLALSVLLLACFFFFIRHDLRARKRTEAALQASDRRFRGVLESAPDAMVISDPLGIISLFNPQAARLFGYTQPELAGRSLGSLLVDRAAPAGEAPAGEDEDAARLTRARALTDLQARGAQLDGVRQTGERFPVDISQSPLESEHEHLLITIIRDRTEQQQAEDALRKFSLDLARSNAELERFAYVASHDLQEPLRMVSSYTQLLSKRYKGKLDANADEFIAYAVDGATRMQKLIGDLLALSRVGTQAQPSLPVETGEVLRRVLNDLRPIIEASGAEIDYPAQLPIVLADGTQIGQLFQNLIGNGLKFHGEAPPRLQVRVAAVEGEGFWRFSIQDNGIGIEPQYFERIFVIFQRLHGKDRYAGTGIGLAICKKIVERHGGKLWVESKPGEGTTFIFTLPAVPA